MFLYTLLKLSFKFVNKSIKTLSSTLTFKCPNEDAQQTTQRTDEKVLIIYATQVAQNVKQLSFLVSDAAFSCV